MVFGFSLQSALPPAGEALCLRLHLAASRGVCAQCSISLSTVYWTREQIQDAGCLNSDECQGLQKLQSSINDFEYSDLF